MTNADLSLPDHMYIVCVHRLRLRCACAGGFDISTLKMYFHSPSWWWRWAGRGSSGYSDLFLRARVMPALDVLLQVGCRLRCVVTLVARVRPLAAVPPLHV